MASTFMHDITNGVKLLPVQGQSGVAAGAGDNTELTSAAIDRIPTGDKGFMSAVLAIAIKTSLTAAATLSVGVKISESDDGTTFGADEVTQALTVVKTGALTNDVSVSEFAYDLASRKRYIRFKITLDLSAGATDVFVYGASLVLGGSDRLPV